MMAPRRGVVNNHRNSAPNATLANLIFQHAQISCGASATILNWGGEIYVRAEIDYKVDIQVVWKASFFCHYDKIIDHWFSELEENST